MQRKVIALIIAILDHSEIDTEILKVSVEDIEFNEFREMLRVNRITNNMLAVIYDES